MILPTWLQFFFLFDFIVYIILVAAWIIDHFWLTPNESGEIKWATRKKRPLDILYYDNGQCEIKATKETSEEGYHKLKNKWIGFNARPIVEGNPTDDELAKANTIIRRTFFLKDAKIPLNVCYAGKGVVTNAKALAIMEFAKENKQKLPLPLEIKGKKLFANIMWPIDGTTIKKAFPKSWNQAQLRALEKKSELTGMKKGEKYYGKEGLKFFVLPGMIIIAIMVLAIIFLVLGK